MTQPKKPPARGVNHSTPCTQQSVIERLDRAFNGDENGNLGMKVEIVLINKRIETIDGNIHSIMSTLSSKKEIENAVEIERQVQLRLAVVAKEDRQEAGFKTDKKYARRGDVRGFILVAVAIISLLINFYVSAVDRKEETKPTTEDIG